MQVLIGNASVHNKILMREIEREKLGHTVALPFT